MDITIIKARWIQLQGTIKAEIGKITLDNTLELAGQREAMAARLQVRHQLSREEAEVQAAILRLKAATPLPCQPAFKSAKSSTRTSSTTKTTYLA